jgi:hypothetical protein
LQVALRVETLVVVCSAGDGARGHGFRAQLSALVRLESVLRGQDREGDLGVNVESPSERPSSIMTAAARFDALSIRDFRPLVAAYAGFVDLLLARRTADGVASRLPLFAAQLSPLPSSLRVVTRRRVASGLALARTVVVSLRRRAFGPTGRPVVLVRGVGADAITIVVFFEVRFTAFRLAPLVPTVRAVDDGCAGRAVSRASDLAATLAVLPRLTTGTAAAVGRELVGLTRRLSTRAIGLSGQRTAIIVAAIAARLGVGRVLVALSVRVDLDSALMPLDALA